MIKVLEIERQIKIVKSDWTLVKLGDLAEDISKRVDNPAQSGYDRFVGLEHFVSGDLKIKRWGTTENLTSTAKAFQKGDILFARRNAYLRRASLVDFDGICSGDAFVIRENHNKVIPGFLAFLMNSNALWDYANANAAGTMSKRVKWRDLADFEFLLPPFDLQKQIAELLWAGVDVVDRIYNLKLETIKSKRSYFVNSIKGNTYTLLGALAAVNYGLGQPPQKDDFGVAMIRATNIYRGSITMKDMLYIDKNTIPKGKDVFLKKGDLLVVRSGAYTGDVAMVTKEWEGAVAGYDLVVRPNKVKVDPLFLTEYLLEEENQSYFKGESVRSARPHLNSAQVSKTKVPDLNIVKQKEISANLSSYHATINSINKRIEQQNILQQSLINQIF